MLRLLAQDALADAALHGVEQLSFHGYRVAARRLVAACAERVTIELTFAGGSGAEPLDRIRIAVAFRSDPRSACRIDHSHASATAARRAESLAGCVSPVDARYASPETGQIS
jgi:hypothetical protein